MTKLLQRRCALLACVVLLASVALPGTVYAADPPVDQKERVKRIREVRKQSEIDKAGKSEDERREINRDERTQIKQINDEFDDDNSTPDDGIPDRSGQVNIQGLSPVATFDLGQEVTLTFRWIDLVSGATITGPAIGSVVYEVNLDPSDEFTFLPIGVGTSLASDFAASFTIVDFEPFVRATPLDPNGVPIVISGLNDENIAIAFATNVGPIPEPGSLLLLSGGLVAFAGFAARRRLQRRIPGPTRP
jgi:hypothetical protein